MEGTPCSVLSVKGPRVLRERKGGLHGAPTGGGVKRDSYVYTAYVPKTAKYVRIVGSEFLNSYESPKLKFS